MTVDSILQKLFDNPDEVEKLAQEQLQVKEQVAYAEKVAEEAGYDISSMSDEQKLQLLALLSQQLESLEAGQAGQAEQAQPQAQAQARPDAVQHAEQAQAITQQQPVSEEFQMKVAENMYFGEQFGEVAAYKFAQTVLPILEEMRKLAEAFEKKEDKKEDKKESSFEALAKSKAEEIKKEAQTKKLAFDQLVEQRAREILAGK
jgi:hypothetical protein